MDGRWTGLGYGALVLIVLAAGAWMRLEGLERRAVHGDEANQAVKAGALYDTGRYAYDPHEHHGPTLYYATLLPLWLSGAADFPDSGIAAYRVTPALFSIGTLALLLLLTPALGRGAVIWALCLCALSPALVFYGRYYIQESLLVFFALAALICGERYFATQRGGWAVALGASLGLVHGTKETCVILFAAMGAALVATRLRVWWPERATARLLPDFNYRHAGLAVFTAATVSVVLFSSFFTHLRGPLDSLLTYVTYAARSEGAGSTAVHEYPWYHYLKLLIYTQREAGPVWSEAVGVGVGVLGLFLAFTGMTRKPENHRPPANGAFVFFLAVYTLLALCAFSLIQYKTPWNLLPFYQPLLILGGVAVHRVVSRQHIAARAALTVLAVAAIAHLGLQYRQTNVSYAADDRNPYVFGHTSPALVKLVELVEATAAANGGASQMPVYILKPDGDYWPLPWYLRKFPSVGYWQGPPSTYEVPVIIADTALRGPLSEALGNNYVPQTRSLRRDVLLDCYIRRDYWDRLLESRSTN